MQTTVTARWRACACVWLLGLAVSSAAAAAESASARGTVRFEPTAAESQVPERFRLAAGSFAWQAEPLGADSPTVEVWDVTFPSPVQTPFEANNTVHCEYFQPKRPGKRPAVIVLHILGGDFPLSRLFCNRMAQQGVAALFVKMPFYGPRRGEGIARRMISVNPDETVEGMTQAVLDIRRAVAWLAARDEVDADQIGIFGISLGGITGALAATAEPRIQNVCLLLAGGDIGRIDLDAAAKKVPGDLPKALGDKEAFRRKLALIDPITYAKNARGKRILMLNAARDEVIPRVCTESLHQAFGEPEIVWYSGGHYSVIRHLFGALDRVANFFAAVDGAGAAREIYPLGEPPLRWKQATRVSANRPLGRAGRYAEPSPLDVSLAWDHDHLMCYCSWPVLANDGKPDSRKVRLYLTAGNETRVLARDVAPEEPLIADMPSELATVVIPWKELGIKPVPGQELRMLATISCGDGPDAIVHTSGELSKQPVEQSVGRWPKYKLAEKP